MKDQPVAARLRPVRRAGIQFPRIQRGQRCLCAVVVDIEFVKHLVFACHVIPVDAKQNGRKSGMLGYPATFRSK